MTIEGLVYEVHVQPVAEVATSAPLWAVLVPLVLGVLLFRIGSYSEKLRDVVAILACGISLVAVISLLPITMAGGVAVFELSFGAVNTPLAFRVDGLGALFALVTTVVWLLAALFAVKYMDHEHARTRFWGFLIVTLAADLGVLLAADFLTLFIFFELLAVCSYVLVIHEETAEAKRAGIRYILVGIIGGLALLGGLVMLRHVSGSLAIRSAAGSLEGLGALKYIIAALMLVGFGAKAGMFPIHIWLPQAHPVAPSPASALLSGIMVKAGIYGIARTVLLVFNPLAATESSAAKNIGLALIVLAIITMTLGWFFALLQDNLKRLLAYSTISQIGYILMGLGCAAFLADRGALGLTGALYHVINHALYKALLFLMAGAILYQIGELSMRRLGGLARTMPVLTACMAVAVLGIIGVPFFNGYISKALLYPAVVASYEQAHLGWMSHVKLLYTIAGGGTVAYYIKVIHRVFLGRPHPDVKPAVDIPLSMSVPMGLLCVLMLVVAWWPHLALHHLILPALPGHGFDPAMIRNEIVGFSFFGLEDLLGIFKYLGIGAGIYGAALLTGLLDRQPPAWLSFDALYGAVLKGFLWLCREPVVLIDRYLLRLVLGRGLFVAWDLLYGMYVRLKIRTVALAARATGSGFAVLDHLDRRAETHEEDRWANFANLDFDLLVLVVFVALFLLLSC